MTTVVVIGGGIAGYTAAMAARRDGASVTVVARAPGATALYAGGMEIVTVPAAAPRVIAPPFGVAVALLSEYAGATL